MSEYRVKVIRFASGERLPVLVDELGTPLFSPTLFAVTELRMPFLRDRHSEHTRSLPSENELPSLFCHTEQSGAGMSMVPR